MNKIIKSLLVISLLTGLSIEAAQTQTVLANTQLPISDFANHWAKNEIEWAIKNKLMWKYADGTFRPEETITQAQFLTSLVAVEGLKEKTAHPATAGHWAKDAYEKAAKANWFTPDIKIDPNARITRYEAAAWITNAWGYKTYDPIHFTYENLLINSSNKFINGLYNESGKKFANRDYHYFFKTALPTDKFTRAETAHSLKLIYKRKTNIAEAYEWMMQIQKSMYIKDGKVCGKIPKLPRVQFEKEAGASYWDGIDEHDGKNLRTGENFCVPAKGKITFGASFDSNIPFVYYWTLPNLIPNNQLKEDILKRKVLNNRNNK